MQSWKKPTDDLVQKALDSVKTDVDRRYFFSNLKNPHWIMPLKKKGFFENPPSVEHLPDGYIQFPFWPEMEFLKNVANEASEDVIEIVSKIPKTNNSRFYEDLIDIALQVEGSISTKLKPRILEYIQGDYPILHARFERVLCYWTDNEQIESALELTKALIKFHPDPLEADKQARREKNPEDWTTFLEPQPRFRDWEYQEVLEKGVRYLSEKAPYQTARILIDATVNMLYLRFHRDQLDKVGSNDLSTIWCPRVNESPEDYRDSKENLIHVLTFACEKVYEKEPESIADLDRLLREQRWDLHLRIRQHLYAKFLNEQTKPWIRDLILDHPNYGKWELRFEFQRMIRLASEHFGDDLLTEEERTQIFEAILSGPSEQSFRDWTGEQFTKELFEGRKRYFHKMQLNPFASVLFGEYLNYFQELKAQEEKPIRDDDYAPHKSEGGKWIGRRSPKPTDELKKMQDEEFLSFLNEWDNVGHDPDDRYTEITFEALAEAFREIFLESIVTDESRLRFWSENKPSIERPIYVRTMVSAIQEHVKDKQFDRLDEWFDLCEWVLSHPVQSREEGVIRSDGSKTHPDWSSSRRAVGDFVETCLKQEVDVPIFARDRLASLLSKLCMEYDQRLDEEEPVFLNRDDQLTEAINNTRGRALNSLVEFAYWERRQIEDEQVDTPEVCSILEKRFGADSERPLALPEHALLGMHYGRICNLNRDWAKQHRRDFFPQKDMRTWREAFGNFLKFNRANISIFEIIQNEFEFALENVNEFNTDDHRRRDFVDRLGEHLFTYYLWDVYPLTGYKSLLDRFYQKTQNDKERWSHLFDGVGRRLKNSGQQLDEKIERKIIDFFNWRFDEGESSELKEFSFWMEAECLNEEWRLNTYSQLLDLYQSEEIRAYTQLESLRGMLDSHTALVVECLAKLTDLAIKSGRNAYIHHVEQARPILETGLKSEDTAVKDNAKQARDNLLRRGYIEFRDLED